MTSQIASAGEKLLPKETEEQRKYRESIEDQDDFELTTENIWNIAYYALIIMLGFVIMWVISSDTFQSLASSLGKLGAAAVSTLSFFAKNPWLILLLAAARPLYKVLGWAHDKFKSRPDHGKSSKFIDKLFTDKSFRGRNENFAKQIRAAYADMSAPDKALMKQKLNSLAEEFPSDKMAKKIKAENPTKSAAEKAKLLSDAEIQWRQQKGRIELGDLMAAFEQGKVPKPQEMILRGVINSAQNGGDIMRSGGVVSKVDARNIIMAAEAFPMVSGKLKGMGFDTNTIEKLGLELQANRVLVEAEIRLQNTVAILNNSNVIKLKGANARIDTSDLLNMANVRVNAEIKKSGRNLTDVDAAERSRLMAIEIDKINADIDPNNAFNYSPGDINTKTGRPNADFTPPAEYANFVKKKGFFSSKVTTTFGADPPRLNPDIDLPKFDAPNMPGRFNF